MDNMKNSSTVFEAFGFSRSVARSLSLDITTEEALSDNTRENVELIRKYSSNLADIEQDYYLLLDFLKQPVCENLALAQIPHNYGFSPDQTEKYLRDPLTWSHISKRLTEYCPSLDLVIPNYIHKANLIRDIALYATCIPMEEVDKICKKLYSLSGPCEKLEIGISKWWFLLFSCYSGTLLCIHELEKFFCSEYICEILFDNPIIVRDFYDGLNPFAQKDKTLQQLKEKYACYLRK